MLCGPSLRRRMTGLLRGGLRRTISGLLLAKTQNSLYWLVQLGWILEPDVDGVLAASFVLGSSRV